MSELNDAYIQNIAFELGRIAEVAEKALALWQEDRAEKQKKKEKIRTRYGTPLGKDSRVYITGGSASVKFDPITCAGLPWDSYLEPTEKVVNAGAHLHAYFNVGWTVDQLVKGGYATKHPREEPPKAPVEVAQYHDETVMTVSREGNEGLIFAIDKASEALRNNSVFTALTDGIEKGLSDCGLEKADTNYDEPRKK